MKIKKLALLIGILGATQGAIAADLFSMTGTVTTATTETRSFAFKTASDVLDSAKNNFLAHSFTTYNTGLEAANLNVNFRGLPMQLQYATNDQYLQFFVPSLNIQQVFAGATRDESQRLFSEFMKKEGGAILSQIMKKLAEVSPSDPVAGNPNSLMSQMVASDFTNGFMNPTSQVGSKPDGDNTSNLIGVGARFSSLRQNGITNNSFTLPLSYTVRSDLDPRRQLIVSLPLTYMEVEGAKAYNLGAGVAYRQPLSDNWTITPAINYGAAGSKDLGSYGQAVSASITSSYVIERDGYDIAIGNMVGYYKSLKLSAGGYSYDPDIKNTVFRNGIMLSQPVSAFGRKMSIEYSLIDTRFTGSALYIEHYNELGITLGTNKNASSARSFFRAGASYLHAPNTKGLTLNLGYWF